MIRGIHHVALVVEDMERMLAFFEGTLGFTEAARMSWKVGADEVDRIIDVPGSAADIHILRAGNAYLELFRFHVPEGAPLDPRNRACDRGIRHLAFDVTDIDSEYRRLQEAGIVFNCPPVYVELEGRGLRAAYFRDPEGNIIELQELLAGATDPMALPGVAAPAQA